MTRSSGRLTGQSDGATLVLVRHLLDIAPRGLAAAYLPETGEFSQTVRGVTGPDGVRLQAEGRNLRYAAMAALGLARAGLEVQHATLAGGTAADVSRRAYDAARTSDDPGAVALVAWAEAEVSGTFRADLFERLVRWLDAGAALPTVDVSWMVTAAVAAAELGDTKRIVHEGSERLLRERGARGIYPHLLPRSAGSRWRSHVGSFADQVYPVQALARAAVLTGDLRLLDAADVTARRICELQGPAGQWWWHYDSRDGGVVEGYPVYSVHQHAMAPMVLHDLLEAGGADHRDHVEAGLGWLTAHPEVVEELVSDRFGVIWRKVGRREPPKAGPRDPRREHRGAPRAARARPRHVRYRQSWSTTSAAPTSSGWLLYAWLAPEGAPRG